MRKRNDTGPMTEPRRNALPLLLGAVILALLTISGAAAATLMWEPGDDITQGYKVHYGTSAAAPSQTIDVGNVTQYSIDHLPLQENVEYFFSVSAYNAAGQSPPTAAIAYTPDDSTPPPPPEEVSVE